MKTHRIKSRKQKTHKGGAIAASKSGSNATSKSGAKNGNAWKAGLNVGNKIGKVALSVPKNVANNSSKINKWGIGKLSRVMDAKTFIPVTNNSKFDRISQQCYAFSQGCIDFMNAPTLKKLEALKGQIDYIIEYGNQDKQYFIALLNSQDPKKALEGARTFLFKLALLSDHLKKHMETEVVDVDVEHPIDSSLYEELLFFVALDGLKKKPDATFADIDEDIVNKARLASNSQSQSGGAEAEAAAGAGSGSPPVLASATITTVPDPTAIQTTILAKPVGVNKISGSNTTPTVTSVKQNGQSIAEVQNEAKGQETAEQKAEKEAKEKADKEAKEKADKEEKEKAEKDKAGAAKSQKSWIGLVGEAKKLFDEVKQGKFNPDRIASFAQDMLDKGGEYMPNGMKDMIQSAIDNKTLPEGIMQQMKDAVKGGNKTALNKLIADAMGTIKESAADGANAGANAGAGASASTTTTTSAKPSPIFEVYGTTIYEGYKTDKLINLENEFNTLYSKQFILGPYKAIRAYRANPKMTDDDVKKFMNSAYVASPQITESESGLATGLPMSEIQKGAKQIVKDLEKSNETTWSNMKTKKSYHIIKEGNDVFTIMPA